MSKRNKYRNKKATYNDIQFDSIKEMKRYKELQILENIGEIHSLVLQPKFVLQESFKFKDETHQKIVYIADFQYVDTRTNKTVVEDVKGFETDVFRIKQKLLLKKFLDENIDIDFKVIKR